MRQENRGLLTGDGHGVIACKHNSCPGSCLVSSAATRGKDVVNVSHTVNNVSSIVK
jgi:hypothetical protein